MQALLTIIFGIMKYHFPLLLLFLTTVSFSQEKFSKEFSMVTDNDLYISREKDRYYSNGLFLSYSYVPNKFNETHKKIITFTLGHQIYTPFKSTVVNKNSHDRPFAGFLYGQLGISKTLKNNSTLKNSFFIGVVGESAFGQELQEAIHEIYNFKKPDGWKYQIRNTFALNFEGEYLKSVGINKSSILDGNFLSKLRIGTIFTDASLGFIGRIGFKKLQPINNSIAFNTNLNHKLNSLKRELESFLYYEASATYVVYDATIQGSLFNNLNPITFMPKKIIFDLEVGYKFTANRFHFGYAYHFHTNKLNNLRFDKGNDYGKLFFSYLIR